MGSVSDRWLNARVSSAVDLLRYVGRVGTQGSPKNGRGNAPPSLACCERLYASDAEMKRIVIGAFSSLSPISECACSEDTMAHGKFDQRKVMKCVLILPQDRSLTIRRYSAIALSTELPLYVKHATRKTRCHVTRQKNHFLNLTHQKPFNDVFR